jgi:Ca2+-binding EF-hand superfamily protein
MDFSQYSEKQLADMVAQARTKMNAESQKVRQQVAGMHRSGESMEDLADSIGDLDAKDIKAKDSTMKALAETVLSKAGNEIEAEEHADPLLQPEVPALNPDLDAFRQKQVEGEEAELKALDARAELEDLQELPAEMVFSVKAEGLSQIDSNGDGLLSGEELTHQLRNSMTRVHLLEREHVQRVEGPEMKKLLKTLDASGDGYIQKEELLGEHPTRTEAALFEVADEDNSGKLNANELLLYHHPEFSDITHDKFIDYKVEDFIDQMDPKKTGRINKGRFEKQIKHDLRQMADNGRKVDEKREWKEQKRHFEAVAGNKKYLNAEDTKRLISETEDRVRGFIPDEVATWKDGHYPEVVKEIILIGDDNKDGKLSLDEIIRHVKDFGGRIDEFMQDPAVLTLNLPGDDAHARVQDQDKFVTKAGQVKTR